MKKLSGIGLALTVIAVLLLSIPAFAQDDAGLAKRLANPVASLVSLPIQANYDENFGADDGGTAWKTNVQPVLPFTMSEGWNIISRTILPIIDQDDIPVNGEAADGIGDILQSFFFSPKEPTSYGLIWGVGPAILLPTASETTLGADKWGIGPTVVALKQEGPWTFGALVNHVESFEGKDDRPYVSKSFAQPFVAYITKTKTTLALNTESTYDWNSEEWSVPLNLTVKQLLKVGGQPLQIGAGARYWANSPTSGPNDWGLRLELTFLFPKR